MPDPVGNVVLNCPPERAHELRRLYDALLGEDRWRLPHLVFDEADLETYVPPRWPDPDHPQQMHLDLFVVDLDAALAVARDSGAALLSDLGDHRVLADPLGHPFCLWPDPDVRTASPGAPPARLGRIVIDCPDPDELAVFYGELLDIPVWVEESDDLVVIATEDGALPMLGFQRVSPYLAPRWPDPAFPAQVHLDLKFDDRAERAERVLSLGGSLLPPQGGSCPVYADPAGHPFCLCLPGE